MTGLGRTGATLLEILLVAALCALVTHAALGAVARVRVVHRVLVERADVVASARTAGALLRAETSVGSREADWGVGADTMWLRAYRGTGLVCPDPRPEPDEVAVSWNGYRLPDPEKDSVLLVDATGPTQVVGLLRVVPGPQLCADVPLERGLTLDLSAPAPSGVTIARVFERGVYAISGAALRYRRGAGGRQPVTAEVWAPSSGWVDTDGRLTASLVPLGSARPWGQPVAGIAP